MVLEQEVKKEGNKLSVQLCHVNCHSEQSTKNDNNSESFEMRKDFWNNGTFYKIEGNNSERKNGQKFSHLSSD